MFDAGTSQIRIEMYLNYIESSKIWNNFNFLFINEVFPYTYRE